MNTARKLRTVFEKPKNKLSLVQNQSASFKKFFKKEEMSAQDMVIQVLESFPNIRGKSLYQKVANMSGEANLTKALKQEIHSAVEHLQSQGDLVLKGAPDKNGLKNVQLVYKNGKSSSSSAQAWKPADQNQGSPKSHPTSESSKSNHAPSPTYSEDHQTLLMLFKDVPKSVWKNLSHSTEMDKFRQSLCSTLERMSNKRQKPEWKQCQMGFETLCYAYDMKLLDEKWFLNTLNLDPETLRIYIGDTQ
ncbi:MAG: hypothetical protein M9899_08615 [Bdellovibrionaceae bacterium]|nr:hypothetical protein [Pseudobdellovibrionaceae bacterium]